MLKPSLQLRVGQQLTMTPQLQQAIRLLQLPILELNAQLQQLLDSNVMLELEEPAERDADLPGPAETVEFERFAADGDRAPAATETAGDFDYDPDESGVLPDEVPDSPLWNEASAPGRSDPWSDDDRQAEIADESGQSLREHLLWQLEMDHFSPREALIGEALIDCVNDDGYLTETTQGILAMLPATAGFLLAEVEQVLARVQALDPPGVGARPARVHRLLQLRQLAPATRRAWRGARHRREPPRPRGRARARHAAGAKLGASDEEMELGARPGARLPSAARARQIELGAGRVRGARRVRAPLRRRAGWSR
jgi:RNA polymerase sigma-54 factor